MICVNKMSLVELAQYYSDYADISCLEELERREKISAMSYDECMEKFLEDEDHNGQTCLDFDVNFNKKVTSTENTNNINDPWTEVYEAGYRSGVQHYQNVREK